MCDSLFLPVVTHRRVSFLAKKEYFTGHGLKGRAKAAFVRGTGLIPLDRDDPNAAAAALQTGALAVQHGLLLHVCPEGTRSPDGRLSRGKTGVARMAMETGVPVLPVAMRNTDRVQPIGRVVPRLARVGVTIGAPLYPPAAARDPHVRRQQARQFTEQIMTSIAHLSGQQRVDIDATDYKRHLRLLVAPSRDADPERGQPAVYPSESTMLRSTSSARVGLDRAPDLQARSSGS